MLRFLILGLCDSRLREHEGLVSLLSHVSIILKSCNLIFHTDTQGKKYILKKEKVYIIFFLKKWHIRFYIYTGMSEFTGTGTSKRIYLHYRDQEPRFSCQFPSSSTGSESFLCFSPGLRVSVPIASLLDHATFMHNLYQYIPSLQHRRSSCLQCGQRWTGVYRRAQCVGDFTCLMS